MNWLLQLYLTEYGCRHFSIQLLKIWDIIQDWDGFWENVISASAYTCIKQSNNKVQHKKHSGRYMFQDTTYTCR